MLYILMPSTLVSRSVWPVIGSLPMLLVILILTVILESIREGENAIAMLLVILELSGVRISTWESDGTISVHFILYPVATVHATILIDRPAIAMPFAVELITLVSELWHFAIQSDRLRKLRNRLTDGY